MTEVLCLEGHASGYAGVPVTADVSLSVEAGEVVALLGPNGAGKTTTLLALSALLPTLAGSVRLFGEEVGGRHSRTNRLARRGLAHVPEDRSLFPDLTVAEHLRACHASDKEGIADALRHFPALEPLMKRRAVLLSGGEQQMLALARAFASRPRMLVVDELSLGLAPVIVERILPALRAFAEERGAGVLLVEQHVEMALAVADRAYVMVNGRIVLAAEAEQLRDDHRLLAASYLGQPDRIQSTEQEREQ
ncbi:MAG TPA: ATP-binding cassette domain-containing protein [Solirubrobacterales bacterium]